MTSRVTSRIVTSMLIVLAATPRAVAAPDWPDRPNPADLNRALQVLRELVTDRNFAEFGFDSKGQAALAALGDPFRRYVVRPSELSKYSSSMDPAGIVHDSKEWIFTVIAEGKPRCLITMSLDRAAWRPAVFGGVFLAPLLVQTRQRESEIHHLDPKFLFVLEVLSPRDAEIPAHL